jgi:hypothetical protein
MLPTSSTPGEKGVSASRHAPTKRKQYFRTECGLRPPNRLGRRSQRCQLSGGGGGAGGKNYAVEYLASRASEFGVPPVTGASAEAAYMSGRKADLAGQGSGP